MTKESSTRKRMTLGGRGAALARAKGNATARNRKRVRKRNAFIGVAWEFGYGRAGGRRAWGGAGGVWGEEEKIGRKRLEILFHPEDVVAEADVAVAAVEERGAVVAGVEGRLGVEDVVDRE